MRSELLNLLRCAHCGAQQAFTLEVLEEDAVEVVRGAVACCKCGRRFAVSEGCVDLLGAEPSRAALEEQRAQAQLDEHTLAESDVYRDTVSDPERMRAFVLNLPLGYPDTEEQAPLVADAIERLEFQGTETVLDLGAGYGWTTAQLADRGGHCVAVDVSTLYLPRSRHFALAGRYFDRVLADMASLPLASYAFDVVFANAAVHHSPDLAATLREVVRVLKPGGRVVFVNEPVVGVLEHGRKRTFGEEARAQGFSEAAYTTREWRRAFRSAGFSVTLEISPVGLVEKAERRRQQPAYARFPRRQALALLARPWLAKGLLRCLRAPILWLHPVNIVIHGRKR